MKRFKKRLTVDSLIMVIASFTFVTSVFFLFHDGSFFDGGFGNAQAVGTFETSHNDVRRRVDSGMTWSNIDAHDKVYEGDSVFTGDQSEASINLENGTVIKVSAKSLVVIHTKDGKTSLDLQYGSLQGTIGKKDGIVISQNGQTQELTGAGSEVRIVKTERAKAVAVQVTKGQIETSGTIIKKDEVVQINDNGSKVTKNEIVLLSPLDGTNTWLALGTPLKFAWRSTLKERLKVEFSRSRSFSEPFYTAEVDGDHHSVSDTNIPEGTFFWRVKPANGDPSLAALLTTYADLPPTPVVPKDEQVYLIDTEKGESQKTVYFTWDDKSGSSEYEIQIAKDNEFRSILKSARIKERVFRYAELGTGTYFWHVIGRHPDRTKSPYSRLMSFSVREGAKSPEKPVLDTKELSYTIPNLLLSRFPASLVTTARGIKPDRMTPLRWTSSQAAKTYEVEVALDPSFSNSVRHDNGEAMAFVPQEVRPGSLYMRVRAKSDDGRVSPASETATLAVSLPAPRLAKVKPVVDTFKSPTELKQGAHEFRLEWTPQTFADSYELQWGSDEKFTKSKKFKVKENERLMKVSKPMAYAARIRSLDANGAPISPFSDVEVASYQKEMFTPAQIETPRVPAAVKSTERLAGLVSTIPIPQLKEPASDIALVSIEDAPTFVSFKWKPLRGATYYTIQIAEDADFTKVVTESKASQSGYVFQKALPEGKVFWRVRAHTSQGYSQWSDPSDINVIYQ